MDVLSDLTVSVIELTQFNRQVAGLLNQAQVRSMLDEGIGQTLLEEGHRSVIAVAQVTIPVQ